MALRARTDPRKSPQQSRSEATVEAIVQATARVLVKEGYDRASTNRIAAAAGVSVGSLYQYFPSKEALVAALVDRHIEEMTAMLEASIDAVHGAPIPVAARALVELMIRAHAVNPKLHKVIAEQVPRTGRLNRLHEVERRVADRIRAYLEPRRSELRTTNLELSVFLLVSAVESLTHAAVVEHPGFSVEALADEITALVVRYVMCDPPSC